jgi:hypothetical protein
MEAVAVSLILIELKVRAFSLQRNREPLRRAAEWERMSPEPRFDRRVGLLDQE